MKLVTLYSKRFKLYNIFKKTKKFWSVDLVTDDQLKNECENIIYWMKVMVQLLFVAAVSVLLMFNVRALFQNEVAFIYPTYSPDIFPNKFVLFFQEYVFCYGIPVVICFDGFFFCSIILAQIQFKLLNYEFSMFFEGNPEKTKIKRLVDHHDYVLQ